MLINDIFLPLSCRDRWMHHNETLLQVLSSTSPDSRVTLSMIHCTFSGETLLRLRQESYSEDVGWFAQSHIDLTPDQMSQFKGMMGPATALTRSEAKSRLAPGERFKKSSTESNQVSPAILKMPSVMAG